MTARSSLRARRTNRGSATVLATVLIAAMTATSFLALVAGVVLADHRRAQAAADLGALAGASALQHGKDACAVAGRLALANGAVLVGCEVSQGTVLVEVTVERRFAHISGEVQARARAGPAGSPQGRSLAVTVP